MTLGLSGVSPTISTIQPTSATESGVNPAGTGVNGETGSAGAAGNSLTATLYNTAISLDSNLLKELLLLSALLEDGEENGNENLLNAAIMMLAYKMSEELLSADATNLSQNGSQNAGSQNDGSQAGASPLGGQMDLSV